MSSSTKNPEPTKFDPRDLDYLFVPESKDEKDEAAESYHEFFVKINNPRVLSILTDYGNSGGNFYGLLGHLIHYFTPQQSTEIYPSRKTKTRLNRLRGNLLDVLKLRHIQAILAQKYEAGLPRARSPVDANRPNSVPSSS